MSAMKKSVFFLLFSFPGLSLYSQNYNEIVGLLNRISEKQPADQIFIHTDRNLYNTGDTIRFQAFIRDRQTGVIETPSISLFVLLLNSDHVTIDSARFRISYSTASGWLKIPEITALGNYSILAYTSDQMNYSPEFAFRTPIRIDKIGPGHSGADSILQSKSASDLRFLPEGGTYIYGIRQRLAFNAVTSTGKSVKASGDIVNQEGKKITDFRSGPYGPGVVEFTPVQGETYYAKPVEAEFGNMSWPLPEPEKTGISLKVNSTRSESVDIAVSRNGTGGKDYFLTITMNNILVFSKDINLDTLFNIRIETDELPSGTAFVTIYNDDLYPVAERAVFLNRVKRMKVHIEISPSVVRPGNETEISINTITLKGENISSIVSVSVIDSISGLYSGIPYPDIETIFLYEPEFYNNLPQPIKCRGLCNIDSRSLDLLLMTYGWRKYKLTEMIAEDKEPEIRNYDHIRITNPGPEKNALTSVTLLSPEGGREITVVPDRKREALIPFDSLDVSARRVMIIPDEKISRNRNPVIIEFPSNPVYSDKAKSVYADSVYEIPSSYKNSFEGILFNPDSAVMIEPVTIKGKQTEQKKYIDKNAEDYKYSWALTLYSEDFKFAHTFEDILYKLNPYKVFKNSKRVILRAEQYMPSPTNSISDMNRPRTALFVVDETPIFDRTYYPIAQLPASEIASVTVIRGPQGFARYGNDARYGMILVTTKTGNRINEIKMPDEDADQGGEKYEHTRIFRTEVEYYIPTKEQVELIPEYQFRPTLLWKSDVYLDGSGPVKFKYPNNMGKGNLMIFVNGMSTTNLVGSGKGSYVIK